MDPPIRVPDESRHRLGQGVADQLVVVLDELAVDDDLDVRALGPEGDVAVRVEDRQHDRRVDVVDQDDVGLYSGLELANRRAAARRRSATDCDTLGRPSTRGDMDSIVAAQHREQRFRTLYDDVYGDLLRFVRRRVHPKHAEDVVSEVMLVAWRRLDDVPSELSPARAWLFGVARHTLLNTGRRERKHEALPIRLAEADSVLTDGGHSADLIAARVDISRAWRALNPIHQEALALAVFDGLSAPEAATVLDISPTAFRLRLSRARRTLTKLITSGHGDGPLPGETTYARSPT